MIDILLISGFRFDEPNYPIGTGFLSEALEAGGFSHECCDVNITNDEEILAAIDRYEPKHVGLGSMSHEVNKNYQLLEKIKTKHPEVIVIFGGPHAIAEGAAIFSKCPAIDILVKGEGEVVLCQIIRNAVPYHSLPGVTTRDGEGPPQEYVDVSRTLFPKYKKFDLKCYPPYVPIASSRGCVYNCAFCGAPNFLGSKWRAFSTGQIINEFLYWYGQGLRYFSFADSLFLLKKQRVEEFCDFIISNNYNDVVFTCDGVRADHFDFDTFSKMKKAHFEVLSIGVESIHDRSLTFLNKKENFAAIESCLNTVDKVGASVSIYLIAGIPYETYEDMRVSLRYVLKHKCIASFSMVRLTPILGTPYYEFAKKNDLIFDQSSYPSTANFTDFSTSSPWVSSKQFQKLKREIDSMHLFLLRRNYLRRWFDRNDVSISLNRLYQSAFGFRYASPCKSPTRFGLGIDVYRKPKWFWYKLPVKDAFNVFQSF